MRSWTSVLQNHPAAGLMQVCVCSSLKPREDRRPAVRKSFGFSVGQSTLKVSEVSSVDLPSQNLWVLDRVLDHRHADAALDDQQIFIVYKMRRFPTCSWYQPAQYRLQRMSADPRKRRLGVSPKRRQDPRRPATPTGHVLDPVLPEELVPAAVDHGAQEARDDVDQQEEDVPDLQDQQREERDESGLQGGNYEGQHAEHQLEQTGEDRVRTGRTNFDLTSGFADLCNGSWTTKR